MVLLPMPKEKHEALIEGCLLPLKCMQSPQAKVDSNLPRLVAASGIMSLKFFMGCF